MNVKCPSCGRDLPSDDVNVDRDTALCRPCERTFSFADLVRDAAGPSFDQVGPPGGVWVDETIDGFSVRASTGTCKALLLVPFTIFWSGSSLGGIYGTQFAEGEFNPILSLIGLPFLLITVGLGTATLMSLFGRVAVSVSDDRGEVFTGVWPVGSRRRFAWREVVRVVEHTIPRGGRGGGTEQVLALVLADGSRIDFNTMLSDERRSYLSWLLRRKLLERDKAVKPARDVEQSWRS